MLSGKGLPRLKVRLEVIFGKVRIWYNAGSAPA
jgi:hypothetical protein